jgi:hypothetical protein
MNIAILTISSLSLVCSAGTLLIMAKTAKEMQNAKTQVDRDIENIKSKVTHNAKVVKTALSALDI